VGGFGNLGTFWKISPVIILAHYSMWGGGRQVKKIVAV
jgi:hypothetical protein